MNLDDTARKLKELLEKSCCTVSFAESCTGGLVSSLITSIAGASKVFKGGIVAYSDEVKQHLLGVESGILQQHGAVSRECAEAMALGAATRLETDYALAITGIAGPDGGSAKKPVGTVWFGLAARGTASAVQAFFSGDRAEIRETAAQKGLELITATIIASFELDNPTDGGVTLGQV